MGLEKILAGSLWISKNSICNACSIPPKLRIGRFTSKASMMLNTQVGVDLAIEKAAVRLAEHNRQYNNVKKNLRDTVNNCEIMRERLEELADFLQQLLITRSMFLNRSAR